MFVEPFPVLKGARMVVMTAITLVDPSHATEENLRKEVIDQSCSSSSQATIKQHRSEEKWWLQYRGWREGGGRVEGVATHSPVLTNVISEGTRWECFTL
jgi:hypothetical protein